MHDARIVVLQVGLEREATAVVTAADSATLVTPFVPEVYASARMIAFAVDTCAHLRAEHLAPEETSVGVRFQLTHEAATPIGVTVRVRVRLVEIDRQRCVFEVEGHDERDRITTGCHEPFVVERERFMARVRVRGQGVAPDGREG